MGTEDVHAEAAQPTSRIGTIAYPGSQLPDRYIGLVFAKWMKSYRHGNDFIKLIDPASYWPIYREHIARLLSKPETVVRLAVLVEDPDVVLGFSVCRSTVLDYVWVLRIRLRTPTGIQSTSYRGMGIGKSLVPKEIDTITHLTKSGLTIWGSKYGHFKFNPFA